MSRTNADSTPFCGELSYHKAEGSKSSQGSSEDHVISEDEVDRCVPSDPEETRRLLSREDDDGKRRAQSSRPASMSSPTSQTFGGGQEIRRQMSATRTSSSDSVSNVNIKRDSASSHHSYHFRRKLANFRSDSVFSDVMPIASSSTANMDPRKSSDPCEKTMTGSGSLSSLKHKESKWISLRKKLKISSSSSGTSSSKKCGDGETTPSGTPTKTPQKHSVEKRSLFQRAKTMSILPVGKVRGDNGEERIRHRKQPHPIHEPKELFNVGGEMNMIPLEFLIDINDLKIGSK